MTISSETHRITVGQTPIPKGCTVGCESFDPQWRLPARLPVVSLRAIEILLRMRNTTFPRDI